MRENDINSLLMNTKKVLVYELSKNFYVSVACSKDSNYVVK